VIENATSLAVSNEALSQLGERVAVPCYDRSALRRSIVHIGVGGFHRAHLATYVDDLARSGDTDWAIVGAGIMAGDATIADVLARQDHLYTLVSRSADHSDVTIIGSIVDFVLAADDSQPLIDRIADADTQIISMTITEGGYPVDDVTGGFLADASHPDGTFAIIARGLDQRRRNDGPALTVMSCDNIMTNGAVARTALLGEAARTAPGAVDWIEANVRFPNSMVDRITPATTPSDRHWLEREYGITDEWPVVAEPFRQWVVEDDFGGDRLPLDAIDVIVADDIDPYELTKLRLLNAGHSCLAYLASLSGFERVDEAMSDPGLREFVSQLLHLEAKPTLPPAAGIDLDDYIASLLERFSNPGVGDQIARLCLDGTSKFPKFLLPTVRAQLADDSATGGQVALSALALAGWCEYLARTADPSPDPMLDLAVSFAHRSIDEPAEFLHFDAVFSADLSGSKTFQTAFVDALNSLRGSGVQSTLTIATSS